MKKTTDLILCLEGSKNLRKDIRDYISRNIDKGGFCIDTGYRSFLYENRFTSQTTGTYTQIQTYQNLVVERMVDDIIEIINS